MKFTISGLIFSLSFLSAHCQVPCGIYDDAVRIIQLEEDIKTIQKAMLKIHEFSEKNDLSAQDQNQMTRWINTKEQHAQNIQNTMAEYFLAQRVKPKESSDIDYRKYVRLTTYCHQIIFNAMKTKQTVDKVWAEKLKLTLNGLTEVYFDEHGREHLNQLRH